MVLIWFLPRKTTPLSCLIAETWRVTSRAAPFVWSPPRPLRTTPLASALIVEMELLRTRTGVLPSRVWVTETCRPRLLDIAMLCLFRMALQLLPKLMTPLCILVTSVVCLTLLGAVLLILKVTPRVTALENRKPLRGMQV